MDLSSLNIESVNEITPEGMKSGVKITATLFVPTGDPIEAEDIAELYEIFKEMRARLYPKQETKPKARKKTGAKRTGRINKKPKPKTTRTRRRLKDDIPF